MSSHGGQFGTGHTSSKIHIGEHHAKAAADFLKDQFRRLATLALDDLDIRASQKHDHLVTLHLVIFDHEGNRLEFVFHKMSPLLETDIGR